ncbi:MAG: 4Fe-4S binding protein [Candidatus Marinimicrobia bacterium]|nr:4Fe-4S binding protein [Candidatus Neomarinimicrobiota bacterium]
MSYVITDICKGTCDTACVDVCPVDCIHGPFEKDDMGQGARDMKAEGKSIEGLQLYIDPEVCINCGACEPECPVDAIFEEDELPEEHNKSIIENAKFFTE